jgi:ketosteroid isomerase-like protein
MSTATLYSSAPTGSADEAGILALVETLVQANHDKNAALFAAQYATGAAIFNLAPPLLHDGVDLNEKQEWMDSWATPVGIETRDLKVTVSGDFAFCHGFMRLNGTKRGAERPVDFWMRETLCLERADGGWKIVHEHTSVPFYMDASVRPAFDLHP